MSRRRWSRRWVVAATGDRRRERTRRVGKRARRQQLEERGGAGCGTVTMDENAWAGATANVYVLKYVLEKNLGCKVNIEKLPESTPLFQAMADGKVDVVPEDWNNIDLKVNQKYLSSDTHPEARLERRHRAHRLVHPDVPDEAASRVQDVAGPEGQGVASSRARSPARRGCSSAATRPTCRRTRS